MAKSFRQKTRTITVTTGSEYDFNSRTVGGRKITFKIQTIRGGLAIARGGRRGGIRAAMKKQGGMLVCQATQHGRPTHCIREKSIFVFPGGGAKTRKWGPDVALHGYSKTNRRSRRTRRYSKRRGR